MIDPILKTLFQLVNGNLMLFHSILGMATAIGVIAGGKLLKLFLGSVGKRIISMTNTEIDDEIVSIISSRIVGLSAITGFALGIAQLRKGVAAQHTSFLAFLDYADMVIYVTAVVLVAALLVRIARAVTVYAVRRVADHHQHSELNKTITPLLNRVVTFLIVAVTAIVVFEHFGYSVTSLLTILGAGSLALGLAAQDTLSNMISGFIIMLDRPFRVGDRVKLPSGETGDVYEIGLRSTKILDFDNNVLIVPNNELVKTRIINFGYPHDEIRVVVDVGVSYGADVEVVKSILVRLAKEHPVVLPEPAPEAFLMNFGESALQFRLVCRVASFQEQFIVAEQLRVQTYNTFRQNGIDIPFPQRVVHHTYEKKNALHASRKRKKISR